MHAVLARLPCAAAHIAHVQCHALHEHRPGCNAGRGVGLHVHGQGAGGEMNGAGDQVFSCLLSSVLGSGLSEL